MADKTSSSMTKGLVSGVINLGSSTFNFYPGHVDEAVKLPLVAERHTRWLVCCYVSPSVRLLRCLSGFVSKEEEAFPFALGLLRSYSVHPAEDDFSSESGGAGEFDVLGADGRASEPDMCTRFDGTGREREATFEFISLHRGSVRIELRGVPFKHLVRIGPGYWNLRTSFKVPPA